MSAFNPDTKTFLRTWLWDGAPAAPPFPLDGSTLLVAYAAQAELLCVIALGCPLPVKVLDLFAEFRHFTNGRRLPGTNSLLDALAHFGIGHEVDDARKDEMRDIAIRGGPFTEQERIDLQDYCDSDVVALWRLFQAMRDDGVF